MATRYPPVGFHFSVLFEGLTNDTEIGFQSVSGIKATISNGFEIREGGENRFTHRLPQRADYGNLILKRGLLSDSQLIQWFRDAAENFIFNPVTVTVNLLNENHEPLETWQFINAYPVDWDIDGFDAESNAIVAETIELSYQYFKRLN
jgi:phage tail-like protein